MVVSLLLAHVGMLPHLYGQNLLTNGDFEMGNTGFTSDYVYSNPGTSNLGEYSIVADPKLSQTGNSSFGDHTSGTGLMLHANGSPDTNLAVWRQTVAVQPHQLYVFSGWGATSGRSGGGSNDPNPSVMRIFVNGQLLDTGAQLPATNVWTYFSRYWNSGPTNQALLEIRNGVSLGAGNDFNLDDLSFRLPDSSHPTAHADLRIADETVELRWLSQLGEVYLVQWVPELDATNWFSLASPMPATGGEMTGTDPIDLVLRRFYRVLIIRR
jgi:hypothetical protein